MKQMRINSVKLTKKMVDFVAIIIAMFSLITAVSAAPANSVPFSDIENHKYADAIERLYNAGVVSGTPNGEFQPDRDITTPEFFVMLTKAFYPNDDFSLQECDGVWSDPYIRVAVNHGVLTQLDCFYISCGYYYNNSYSFIDKILVASEYYSRPLEDISYGDKIRKAAIDYGLITDDFVLKETLTRGEVASIINAAMSGNFREVEYKGDFPMKYELEYFEGMDKAFNTIKSYFKSVPEEYINFLNEKGYAVIITPSCAIHFPEFGTNIAGMSCRNERLIYLSSFAPATTIPHEIGHALSFELYDNTEYHQVMSSIYDEKDEVSRFIDERKLYNSDELFAESFAYLTLNKNNEKVINAFKTAAPVTFKVIATLDSKIKHYLDTYRPLMRVVFLFILLSF